MLIKKMLLPLVRKHLALFLIMIFVSATTASLSASFFSVYTSFTHNIQSYLVDYGFPDGFVKLKFDTDNALAKTDLDNVVRTIDGIEQADLHWNAYLNATSPNQNYFICNVKSFNDTDFSKFYYHEKGNKSPTDRANVMVSREMAVNNKLKVGSSITVEISYEGKMVKVPVYIYGIVSRPDTMQAEAAHKILVNREDFGYAYIPSEDLADLSEEYRGKGNEIVFKTKDGFTHKAVLDELVKKLKDGGYITDEQLDEYYTAEDSAVMDLINTSMIHYLTMLCLIVPLAFAFIAMILMSLFIYQIIHHMNREIGILNAIGNSKRSIFGLVAAFASLITLVGSFIGLLAAWPLGNFVYDIIHTSYCMPIQAAPLHPVICVLVVIALLLISLIASLFSARRIQKMTPADAILDNRDKQKQMPRALEKISYKVHPTSIIGLNAIQKNIPRFFISTFTVFASFVLLFVGFSLSSSTNRCISQLSERSNFDATIYEYDTCTDPDAFFQEIGKLKTVTAIEKGKMIITTFTFNDKSYDEILLGLNPNHKFFSIPDRANNECTIEDDCIVLDESIAETLGAKVNDIITINNIPLRVNAISSIYTVKREVITLKTFDKLIASGLKYNNCAFVTVKNHTDFLAESQKLTNAMSLLEERANKGISGNYADVIYVSSILEIFAIVIGFVTLTTIGLLALNEDKRKYCVMQMLGFRIRDVSAVAFIQIIASLIIGIGAAIAPSVIFAKLILKNISLHYVTFPFLNYWWYYALSAGLIILFVAVAHIISTISLKRTIPAQFVNSRE